MKKIFITCATFLILIGVIALAMNLSLGSRTSLLINKERNSYGITWYVFNFKSYITNLNLSITNTTFLQLEMPTREWIDNLTKNPLTGDYWDATWNNMGVALNYIILGLNVIIYPIRIGGYILKNVLAILGINQNIQDPKNGLGWLIELTEWLIARIQIPYV